VAQTRIPAPTPAARQYIRYMLSFGISVGIGLSPLLGKLDIPGFSSILSLYPSNLADVVIPFAALLMSLPALAVQYYSMGRVSKSVLAKWFARSLVLMVLLLLTGAGCYLFLVVRVPVEGGRAFASFVVGFQQSPSSPCVAKTEPLKLCIGREVSFNPDDVEALFPDWQISLSKLILTVTYCLAMCGLGMLVGLVILRERLGT
jgi:hypothetical protein